MRLNPDSQAAHLALGEAFHAKGALPEALAEYREALRPFSQCSDAHFDIGRVLEDEQDFKGARDEYSEVLPNGDFCYHIEDEAEVWHHRGLVSAKLGKLWEGGEFWWDATSDLKMAANLDPGNAQIHFDYGQVLEDRENKYTRDQESALAQYRIAHDLDPKNPRYSAEFVRLSRKLKH